MSAKGLVIATFAFGVCAQAPAEAGAPSFPHNAIHRGHHGPGHGHGYGRGVGRGWGQGFGYAPAFDSPPAPIESYPPPLEALAPAEALPAFLPAEPYAFDPLACPPTRIVTLASWRPNGPRIIEVGSIAPSPAPGSLPVVIRGGDIR